MIALYRGKSWISRAIRLFNWSDYSHVAWLDERAGGVYEAWPYHVRRVANLGTQHTPGTVIDLFSTCATRDQLDVVRAFLTSQIGKPYDFRGVINFLRRRDQSPASQARWFCSELVFAAYAAAGIQLLSRIPAHKVYPGMLAYSPLLIHEDTVITVEGGSFIRLSPAFSAASAPPRDTSAQSYWSTVQQSRPPAIA
jgi:uncharacterized protein YycO